MTEPCAIPSAALALGSNQQLIADLAAAVPAVAQHSVVLHVPPGHHAPADELAVLKHLRARHGAFRLRVLASGCHAVELESALLAPIAHDPIVSPAEAAECIRSRLAQPISLLAEAAARFSVSPLTEGGHLLMVMASHLAIDARSRQVFLAERDLLLRLGSTTLGPTALEQWTRYPEWERSSPVAPAAVDRQVADLVAAPGWAFVPRSAPHPGMRLGEVTVRPATGSAHGLGGLDAMAWFATAFMVLAQRAGLASRPVVALPRTRRRACSAPAAIGDFADHLVIAAPAEGREPTVAEVAHVLAVADEDHVPLRRLLDSLGVDSLADPAPLTQAVVSYQPGSHNLPPFLLDLPGEYDDHPMPRGERMAPIFVPTVPLERQDVAMICSVYRGALRWRLSCRADVVPEDQQGDLEALLILVIEGLR